MDKAYHNINKLGTIIEIKSTSDPCDITPHQNSESTETRYKNQLPPHPEVHRVDIVGRIFGGTIRDRRSKIKDRNQEKDSINFVFNFGLKSELKENENPTEENCTELKIKPTEKAN